METVEELLKSLFYTLSLVKEGKLNPFDTTTKRLEYASLVSTFIYNHTNIDIKPLGELQILMGMCLGFTNIVSMGFDIVENLRNKVVKQVTTDWKGFWAENCESIKIEFLRDQMKLYAKYVKNCEEIVEWANTITLNQYLVKYGQSNGMGDGESSILSYDDEQHDRGSKVSSTIDINGKYENLVDKKVYEYFGVDMRENQDKVKVSSNPHTKVQSKVGTQNSL
jgi:hypothetical protein